MCVLWPVPLQVRWQVTWAPLAQATLSLFSLSLPRRLEAQGSLLIVPSCSVFVQLFCVCPCCLVVSICLSLFFMILSFSAFPLRSSFVSQRRTSAIAVRRGKFLFFFLFRMGGGGEEFRFFLSQEGFQHLPLQSNLKRDWFDNSRTTSEPPSS